MAKRIAIPVGLVLLLALAFYGGLAVGNRRAFRWLITSLETEVSGSQNLRITQLVHIRSGDIELAIQLLELQVDIALSTLPQRREWDDLAPSIQNALLLSKKYRELYPPAEPSPSLDKALAFVPDLPLDPNSCSPAVRHFLERGAS